MLLATSAAVSPDYTTIPATIQREKGAPTHRRRTDTHTNKGTYTIMLETELEQNNLTQ